MSTQPGIDIGEPRVPLDLNELVRSAIEHVRRSVAMIDAPPQIRLHALPAVPGTAALLHQVFVDLVANAMRYTRGVPSPTIEIGIATTCAAGRALYVHDNGIGFGPSRAADAVGLGFVERAVAQHGGRVWADAGAAGTTFYFTLGGLADPAAPPPAAGQPPAAAHPASSRAARAATGAARSAPAPAS